MWPRLADAESCVKVRETATFQKFKICSSVNTGRLDCRWDFLYTSSCYTTKTLVYSIASSHTIILIHYRALKMTEESSWIHHITLVVSQDFLFAGFVILRRSPSDRWLSLCGMHTQLGAVLERRTPSAGMAGSVPKRGSFLGKEKI